MSKEFVVINADGEQVGWVEPVVSIRETKHYYVIKNGQKSLITGKEFEYRFWKYDGWEYITREFKEEN